MGAESCVMPLLSREFGAGYGNRTHVRSLGSSTKTTPTHDFRFSTATYHAPELRGSPPIEMAFLVFLSLSASSGGISSNICRHRGLPSYLLLGRQYRQFSDDRLRSMIADE